MKGIGQYKTENELRKEIKELEEKAAKGELTVPMARCLMDLKQELATIETARTTDKVWPKFD